MHSTYLSELWWRHVTSPQNSFKCMPSRPFDWYIGTSLEGAGIFKHIVAQNNDMIVGFPMYQPMVSSRWLRLVVYHSSPVTSKPPNGLTNNLPLTQCNRGGAIATSFYRDISSISPWYSHDKAMILYIFVCFCELSLSIFNQHLPSFNSPTNLPRPKRAASAAPTARATTGARAAAPSRTTNAAPVQRTAAPKQRAAAPSKTNGGEILGELKVGGISHGCVHTRYTNRCSGIWIYDTLLPVAGNIPEKMIQVKLVNLYVIAVFFSRFCFGRRLVGWI